MVDVKKNDYSSFDPLVFIQSRYSKVTDWNTQPLNLLHSLFQSYGSTSAKLKVLDFGCGPVPIYMCSASLHASEIVFAEYTESNRKTLQMWLNKNPNAPDFTPIFKYVVQDLEGKGEDEVLKRQDDLRCLVKGVVPCNILCDPPLLAPGYEGPYDIVFSSLCVSCATTTHEEYSQAIGRLTRHIKPGGKLILNSVEGTEEHRYYCVGSEKFYSLSVTPELINDVLTRNGYKDINITRQVSEGTSGAKAAMTTSAVATLFTVATKI